jgi:hypothetical protein
MICRKLLTFSTRICWRKAVSGWAGFTAYSRRRLSSWPVWFCVKSPTPELATLADRLDSRCGSLWQWGLWVANRQIASVLCSRRLKETLGWTAPTDPQHWPFAGENPHTERVFAACSWHRPVRASVVPDGRGRCKWPLPSLELAAPKTAIPLGCRCC